jgi:ribosome-associated toxin RatA of RatAB toxin-antitoxin module
MHHRQHRYSPWLAAVLLVLPSLAMANSGWTRIVDEDGVQVMERQLPGQVFPTFRGIGIIDASIYDVLAVVSDIKRHTEWVERCMTVRVLKQRGYRFYVVYSRTDVPWPISDRDAIYRSEVSIDEAKREVAVNFKAVKSKKVGPVDGVVRMVKLKGHFKFKGLSENKTRIDYQIDADPGGWIPKWLARLATRKLPLSTIQSLRKQVIKTRGWYAKRIKQWKAGNY